MEVVEHMADANKAKNAANAAGTVEKPAAKGKTQAAAEKPVNGAATKYTMQEFIDAADTLFSDVEKGKRPSRYIIMAAFRFAKKEEATKEEGRKLIQKFMERKVN